MIKTEISYEQASFINNNDFSKYEQLFYGYLRLFQKNPYLQMIRWDTYEKLMEYTEPIYEKDYSKYLLNKLEEVFQEIENFNNDETLSEYKDAIKLVVDSIESNRNKNNNE